MKTIIEGKSYRLKTVIISSPKTGKVDARVQVLESISAVHSLGASQFAAQIYSVQLLESSGNFGRHEVLLVSAEELTDL